MTRPVLPTNTSRPLLIPVGKLEKDPRIHPPRNPTLQTNSHYSPACSRPTQGDRSTGLGPHSLHQPSRGESGDPASQQPPEAPVVVRSRLRARAPLCCTWVRASDSRAPTSCDCPLHTTHSHKTDTKHKGDTHAGSAPSAPGARLSPCLRGAWRICGCQGPERPGGLCLSKETAKAPEVAANEPHPRELSVEPGCAGTSHRAGKQICVARRCTPALSTKPGTERAPPNRPQFRHCCFATAQAPFIPSPWEPQPKFAVPSPSGGRPSGAGYRHRQEPGGTCAPDAGAQRGAALIGRGADSRGPRSRTSSVLLVLRLPRSETNLFPD